eukprot:285796_1
MRAVSSGRWLSNTLIISSERDLASIGIHKALLERWDWERTLPVECNVPSPLLAGASMWRNANGAVHMAHLNVGLVQADDIDTAFSDAMGGLCVSDVIFLSKHKSSSKRPSLTCHPIGVTDHSEAKCGGRPGKLVPPNPRIAPLLRSIFQAASEAGLDAEYDITLEATHHGPWLASPSAFVEIGSCEEYWSRKEAAAAWGVALGRVLGLDASNGYAVDDDLSPEKSHTLIVGFSQGHYVPKCVDCARRAGVSVGHMIASYGLNFDTEDWRETVRRAISSTRDAFGDHLPITALVDKKTFRSEKKTRLLELLKDELHVNVIFSKTTLPHKPAKMGE